MCDKCVEIDEKIERYRQLARQVDGALTSEQAENLVADLKAQKVAIHLQKQVPERVDMKETDGPTGASLWRENQSRPNAH